MQIPEEKWVQLCAKESFGRSFFGMRIQVACDLMPDLNLKEIQHMTYEVMDKIEHVILSESVKINPAYIEVAKMEREKLIDCFNTDLIYVEEIPNEYERGWHTSLSKWLVVTTKRGRIKIGWRRQVINIDWSESDVPFSAMELFPAEDVTREGKAIHAPGYMKAAEYLSVILDASQLPMCSKL